MGKIQKHSREVTVNSSCYPVKLFSQRQRENRNLRHFFTQRAVKEYILQENRQALEEVVELRNKGGKRIDELSQQM